MATLGLSISSMISASVAWADCFCGSLFAITAVQINGRLN